MRIKLFGFTTILLAQLVIGAGEEQLSHDRYLDVAAVASGRLTLTAGTAVTTSDVTAATSIYYSPYFGSKVALYDGAAWRLYNFTELSLALGTLSSATNYDVFIYNNSGTPALDTPVAWTNDTTRATALVSQDGIYVKSGATTRRYVGTFRTTSTTTTEDSKQNRLVFNAQNRVRRQIYYCPGGASYSYSTAVWRAFGNSSNHRVSAVFGIAGSTLDLSLNMHVYAAVAALSSGSICTDCTNNYDQTYGEIQAAGYSSLNSRSVWTPAVGYHYYQITEYASGGITFYGAYTFLTGFIDS